MAILFQSGRMSFQKLNTIIDRSKLNRRHVNSWRQSLTEILSNGVDGLQTLFDLVNKAVLLERNESWPCIWTSVVGIFLRKMNLLYKRLSFMEVVNLQVLFARYCSPMPHFDPIEVTIINSNL